MRIKEKDVFLDGLHVCLAYIMEWIICAYKCFVGMYYACTMYIGLQQYIVYTMYIGGMDKRRGYLMDFLYLLDIKLKINV